MVDESWHIPPPIPSTTCPLEYILDSLYPAEMVLAPTIELYENSSPGESILPLIFSEANSKFCALSLFDVS